MLSRPCQADIFPHRNKESFHINGGVYNMLCIVHVNMTCSVVIDLLYMYIKLPLRWHANNQACKRQSHWALHHRMHIAYKLSDIYIAHALFLTTMDRSSACIVAPVQCRSTQVLQCWRSSHHYHHSWSWWVLCTYTKADPTLWQVFNCMAAINLDYLSWLSFPMQSSLTYSPSHVCMKIQVHAGLQWPSIHIHLHVHTPSPYWGRLHFSGNSSVTLKTTLACILHRYRPSHI